jgi:hypothetical protein
LLRNGFALLVSLLRFALGGDGQHDRGPITEAPAGPGLMVRLLQELLTWNF